MRVIAQIPHPKFRIIVFSLAEKFLVEIEAGPMKQSFKFDASIGGVEGIKNVLDTTFLDQIHDTFNNMFVHLQAAKERHL